MIFFSIWLGISNLIAQTPEQTFEQANTAFRNGKFEQAIHTYENILKSGQQSPELYYNLGNAYYKTNQIAPAIYNYEKALQLKPHYTEAQNNLAFAQRMAIDIIEPLPKTLFQKLNETLIYPISPNAWAWISIVIAFFSAASIVLYYFSSATGSKKFYFTITFITLGLFLLALSMGIKARHHANHDRPAIVFDKEVSVKSEPGFGNAESFKLHEGAKVQIEGQEEDWLKIRLADGKTGWLAQEVVMGLKGDLE